MWICPKCGRSFRNKNQGHYCGEAPKTIAEYISRQPEGIQGLLRQVDAAIRAAIPDAQEKISWSMPTYRNARSILQFAANKNHLGLYPGVEAVVHFSAQLNELGFKSKKGSIQIPYSDEMPLTLIADIARWCDSTENHASQNAI